MSSLKQSTMKAMECPNCGGDLDVFIDILYPYMSIPEHMLERAVMYECRSCKERSPDFSQVQCPECFEKTVVAEINRKKNQDLDDPSGRIFCTSCDLNLVF